MYDRCAIVLPPQAVRQYFRGSSGVTPNGIVLCDLEGLPISHAADPAPTATDAGLRARMKQGTFLWCQRARC
jgi:hypothetical protein